ncbi:MAG: prolipoprotein diacylglyceryl transferase [Alphaproteobacteria bacterium]|nr:prolipoprotein diacylglyceryl transferase [Alphaproteobacteria bacterium]
MTPLLVPYWSPQVYYLGPIPIDPWATMVCIGFVVGLEIARARGIRKGLKVPDVVDGAVFIVAMGFVVGHLMHVLAYNYDRFEEQGVLSLLKVWEGFSSTGGFIGAVIGALLFYGVIRRRDFWRHADAIVFGFPVGWMFGRTGCFLAHDHIGQPSDFALAVDFPQPLGPRHDLGLYEALFSLGIALIFFALGRKERPKGFFVALFGLLYAPVRFGLDFLRNQDLSNADVRYLSLTPAQWGMILMFLASAVVLAKLGRGGAEPDSIPEADDVKPSAGGVAEGPSSEE